MYDTLNALVALSRKVTYVESAAAEPATNRQEFKFRPSGNEEGKGGARSACSSTAGMLLALRLVFCNAGNQVGERKYSESCEAEGSSEKMGGFY
jgi:hypothetical protein